MSEFDTIFPVAHVQWLLDWYAWFSLWDHHNYLAYSHKPQTSKNHIIVKHIIDFYTPTDIVFMSKWQSFRKLRNKIIWKVYNSIHEDSVKKNTNTEYRVSDLRNQNHLVILLCGILRKYYKVFFCRIIQVYIQKSLYASIVGCCTSGIACIYAAPSSGAD